MITRRTAFTLSLTAPVLVPGGRLWAKGDFWDEKDPAQWTEKEVDKLLKNSPWTHSGSVTMKGGGGMGMAPPSMGTGGGRGGRGGGGGGRSIDTGGDMGGGSGMGGGGGDMGASMPSAPSITATVRWESSKAILDATKKTLPPDLAPFHLLSVIGLPARGMGGGRGPRGPQDAEKKEAPKMDPAQMQAQFEQAMIQAITLERKGKEPLHPVRVSRPNQPGGASVLLVLFPRQSANIDLDDKEVVFHAKNEQMELKVKFNLKDMVYKGSLAL